MLNVRDGVVLVSVLKDRRDLNLLLTKRQYRIPLAQAPKREFKYLAFYQPIGFGRRGKCVRHYAKVLRRKIAARREILPCEPLHPRANEKYLWFQLGKIKNLIPSIKNIVPRRISFGFAALDSLLAAKTILQLYNVPPIEQIIAAALKRAGIQAMEQPYIIGRGKRYRLDFAVFCNKDSIAIECDNLKAHSGAHQRAKDKIKDNFLRRRGWKVIRLTEHDIVSDLKGCITRVKQAIYFAGGPRCD